MDGQIYFHDFGKAAFGTVEVELAGTAGTVVEIAIGEAAVDGRLNRFPGGFCCFKCGKITLTSPRQWYKFEIPPHRAPRYTKFSIPSPWQDEVAPFRYLEVTGDCQVCNVKRHELFPRWDDDAGTFHSSCESLNRIWDFCKYSIKATAGFGVFIDGERERCPYEGDTYINQLGWFCCSRDRGIPRQTLEFFRDNATWPIEWSLLMPVIVRDYVLYSGDEAVVPEFFPVLKARLLDELENEDGLVGSGEFYKELIDWPMTERDGYESAGTSLVPNCVRYMALKCMAELYGERAFADKAQVLKSVIRQKMYRDGKFVDSPESNHTAQHSVFFPVATGIAAPEEMPELEKLDIRCSVYAVQFLFDALYQGRFGDRAQELLCSSGKRSWLNMLDAGATITMEAWDMALKTNSDWNHAWGAAPANIIPRHLCGVRPVKPGFREFVFDPQPGGVRYFQSVHPTPDGEICVEFEDGKFSVKMPGNCRAFCGGKCFTGEFSGTIGEK